MCRYSSNVTHVWRGGWCGWRGGARARVCGVGGARGAGPRRPPRAPTAHEPMRGIRATTSHRAPVPSVAASSLRAREPPATHVLTEHECDHPRVHPRAQPTSDFQVSTVQCETFCETVLSDLNI